MKIKEIIQNPKLCLLILSATIILILCFYGFQSVDYYIDKNAAHLFLNNTENISLSQVYDLYGNKNYLLHNGLFHILTFVVILLVKHTMKESYDQEHKTLPKVNSTICLCRGRKERQWFSAM